MNSRSEKNARLAAEPWAEPWPENDLETMGHCPVCGDVSRKLLHADLVDSAFRAAPGKWALWSCATCATAYLDPRPTPASIHRAYANYYTHQAVAEKSVYASLNLLRKLRRRLTNGYTNWRYSTREFPASWLGIPLLQLLWPLGHRLGSEYRHMPKRPEVGGALLDVGCGSGSFLRTAASCGWDVTGIDPDPKAVMNCRDQGLHVLEGGLEQFSRIENRFDVITLNHVIEHVHDPVSTLKTCYRLLKPHGQLWIATPNTDSLGHQQFGRWWRGLETPRHLVLFNPNSLKLAFERAGFQTMTGKTAENPLQYMTKASEAIRRGISIEQDVQLSVAQKRMVFFGHIRQALLPRTREFLTVVAFKGHSIK